MTSTAPRASPLTPHACPGKAFPVSAGRGEKQRETLNLKPETRLTPHI
jgi:hypothetical protein